MPTLGIAFQFRKTVNHSCSNRIEVNIPHEFSQINLLLTGNWLVSVLEKLAVWFMLLLKLITYPVPNLLIKVARGIEPVLKRTCAWFGRNAHAEQAISVFGSKFESRSKKSSRSLLFLNIFRRSIPLIMIWCKTPGASSRAGLGMYLQVPILSYIGRLIF